MKELKTEIGSYFSSMKIRIEREKKVVQVSMYLYVMTLTRTSKAVTNAY